MNVALWVTQAVLAVVFAGSGAFKGTQAKEAIVASGQTGVVGAAVSHARLARANAARRLRESLNVGANLMPLVACVFVATLR
jgi:hypothetical protein